MTSFSFEPRLFTFFSRPQAIFFNFPFKMWCEKKKKFLEGIVLITDKVKDEQLVECLKNINNETHKIEIAELSPEQNRLIHKTLLYTVQRFNLFLLSPVKLQSDLTSMGFSQRKSEILTEFYSDSNREIIKNLNLNNPSDTTGVTWDIKTTLLDEANVKCKKSVARLSVQSENQEIILENLKHSELLSLFEDFETIQRELDALPARQ